MHNVEFIGNLDKLILKYRMVDLFDHSQRPKQPSKELFFTIEDTDSNCKYYGYFVPTKELNDLFNIHLIRCNLPHNKSCISNTHLYIHIRDNKARCTFEDGLYISSFYIDIERCNIQSIIKEV